jgi:hypothetical protein
MIFAGLVAVIITVCVLRSTVPLSAQVPGDHIPKGPMSPLTWEDFLRHCGPRQALRHRSSTSKAFEEKFRKRTFKWQGEVVYIREGFDVFWFKTKSVVMVRMYPHRFPRRDVPDVALLFGEDRFREVADLAVGDWINFEATMSSHGHRGDPEVMMLWHVAVGTRPSPLSSSPSKEDIEAGAAGEAALESEDNERDSAAMFPAANEAKPTGNSTRINASSEVGGANKTREASAPLTPITAALGDGLQPKAGGKRSSNATVWS